MKLNREQRRIAARHMEKVSAQHTDEFVRLDLSQGRTPPPGLLRVFRNREFLVQEFAPSAATQDTVLVRLTVNLTQHTGADWVDGIGWDKLQAVKNALGYEAFDAVEIYPRACDVVNVAAMRHLWVLKGLLPFAWR